MYRFGTSKSERAFSAVALFLAVLYMAAGVSVWLGAWNPNEYARSLWGLAGILAGLVMVLGVWTNQKSPIAGALLVFAAAVPIAVVFAWTLLPPVLTAFLVMVWARARWVAGRTKEPALSRG